MSASSPAPAPSDYPAFDIIPGIPGSSLVLLADHATNLLPPHYGSLGLPEAAFARHIAYDIGIEPLTRQLAARLGCAAVLSRFSRLLIDPNRGEDDPTLIMKISDGAIVTGNHPISPEEWQRRIALYHRPYHDAIATTLEKVEAESGKVPLVLSLHSFTPYWKSHARPWHAAVLWDSDGRVAHPLIDHLGRSGDLVIGDNEPYDGALKGDTLYRHCLQRGVPHALLEVRQDLIGDDSGVANWTERLLPVFRALDQDPALHRLQVFPSRTGPYPADIGRA
nr:N-formylglutamate amidohydrolase [uncultured Gellertiella sp.]